MAGSQPFNARQYLPPNSPNPLATHGSPNQQEPTDADILRSHGRRREASVSRGRVPALGVPATPNVQAQQSGLIPSPRSQSSAAPARSPAPVVPNGFLERRPSAAHGHYRQPSRAHGNHLQSRNAIFMGSPATSPLSPQTTAPDNASSADFNTMVRRGGSQRQPKESISSTVNGSIHTSSSSTLVEDREFGEMSGPPTIPKRLDRAQSSKTRGERSHQEQKTVGEYALHHLFNKFGAQADYKINECMTNSSDPAWLIEQVCGAGVDPEFDQLIAALAHITRRKPKSLVDTIMYWRKEKVHDSQNAKIETPSPNPLQRTFPRRNTEALHSDMGLMSSGTEDTSYANEHRSAVSIYLTCRVLIEVFIQATTAPSIQVLLDKVEDIVFSQLKQMELDDFTYYPFKYTIWRIYSQLLGVMSDINLQTISRSFTNELRTYQKPLGLKQAMTRELEGRVELIVSAMRHLSIKTQPDVAWKDSCDLLYCLGEIFIGAHGQQIKHAYCNILEELVLPIAANWVPCVNTAKWKDFLNMTNTRLSQMIIKPKHWAYAFRLSTMLLCASPTDYFAGHWLPVATSQQAKLKDRATRVIALQAICRLVWTYLDRVTEPSTSMVRKLDDVMRAVLPSGKKTYLSIDPAVSEPIVELIRIIGYHYAEYCFRTIIFPLMNLDLFASGREIRFEQLEPDRMIVGIKASLAVMADSEKADRGHPPFPRFGSSNPIIKSANAQESNEDGTLRRVVSKVGDPTKDLYARFCEILGKITLLCDNAFGGQAALDEKFGGLSPKTPITETFSFGRKEDHPGLAEQRQGFYELLNVAIQALPRCLSAQIQLNAMINLLCTGTAHVHDNIASSSTQSLKSIARQAHAQPVTIGFARFIFNFDARYSTMSDEGMLGPNHIENTLRLYVELLQIWIEEIKQKTKDAATETATEGSSGSRSLLLDLTSVSALVEEIESHGIFFLCSQSRRVRSYAVKVLKIVTEFDTALGRPNPRIIQILEGDSQKVMDINDETLTVAERSRLQKGTRQNVAQNTLIELASSEVSYDATLWLKLFPNIIRQSFEICPFSVTLGREIVCARLLQMHDSISRLDPDARATPMPGADPSVVRTPNRLGPTSPEVMTEQWKLYLIMACTTMTNAGAQTQSQLEKTQHARAISRGIQGARQDKISSARALFAHVIPLLPAGQTSIRDAIVVALGSININLYRTLLESMQYAVTTCKEEAKTRSGTHQRTGSNPQKDPRTARLRQEVAQVYRLTSRFLHEPAVLKDEWILSNLSTYTKELMIFLSDADVQYDWDCQKLRRQYCGLVEELYDGMNRINDPSRYVALDSRKSSFALMEDWCGFSPNQIRISQREDHMRQSALERHRDPGDKTNITAAMEIVKRDLSIAALSAMAALCVGLKLESTHSPHPAYVSKAGSLRVQTDGGNVSSFDSRRMLSWIDQIFGSGSDKMHAIGRRALHNLIIHNHDFPYLLESSIEKCYDASRPRALESYFDVTTKVLMTHPDYPVAFWRILGAVLFTLGNENGEIRMKSARLLRVLEQRRQQNSKIQDFDISISDRTTAVYKLAQFEISKRLSKKHTELSFFIFSQFSVHFKNIHPDSQRNMVAAILPWIQVIELQVDPNGGPTAQSYMLLANLLEITTKASGVLHNEIQALWQALATGPHGGNVQLVLDFVISLCLDRREQSFVDYAKQIVVYLSSTPAGQKVIEFLLLQITPRNMVQKAREPTILAPDNLGLPYVADLSEALPIGREQHGFSLGQLSLIFLVDLMVAPMKLGKDSVPLLLQAILVLWDHHTSLVQEQAREMLVHLIHELVITKIDDDATTPKKTTIEAFVESIRQQESKVMWHYKERDGKNEEWTGAEVGDNTKQVPESMVHVTREVIDLFALAYPQIQDQLSRTALSWATSCPVRHVACRSLQVFRCISSSLDRAMLADILARLSNTVVHEAEDVQLFSIEMLTTLKTIIGALESADLLQYPHLFWATCASLDTIYEREFVATLGMLDKLLAKVNLNDPAVVKILEKAKPSRWQGSFEGITPLVYKGLKSEMSLGKSLRILDNVVALPDSDLVGNNSRLLFVILANLPCFLQSYDDPSKVRDCVQSAEILTSVAEAQEQPMEVSTVLNVFARRRYTDRSEFLATMLSTLRLTFFPRWELKTVVFLIGLLTNRLHWYKVKTLEVLKVLIPTVDTRRPEIASYGPDLIAPLLRLLQMPQYCSDAMEILDHIMLLSETSMTKHHMRMSMAGLGSRSLSVRKEYEKTQSLYGIPEETGWSIPMPAVHSTTTRANMQIIHHDCTNPSAPEAEAHPTPEIEFHPDEDNQPSYFSIDRADTLPLSAQPDYDTMPPSSEVEEEGEEEEEGDMGDLLSKLNSLDDFFEDSLDVDPNTDVTDRYSNITITAYTPDLDSGAELYDQQTAPIIEKALARTASVSSLHNGFADQRSHRGPGIMTPTAFTPPTIATPVPATSLSSSSSSIGQRPALHSRSVTSPANNLSSNKTTRTTPYEVHSDSDAEETFSEDERSSGYGGSRLLGSTSLRSAQSSIRKMMPGVEGKDYRARGLMRAQSRSHSQAPGSPRVPKVPDAYLVNREG